MIPVKAYIPIPHRKSGDAPLGMKAGAQHESVVVRVFDVLAEPDFGCADDVCGCHDGRDGGEKFLGVGEIVKAVKHDDGVGVLSIAMDASKDYSVRFAQV